ncbi:MAG: PstS family phosphate ABC transporter substrate-binding protein [Bacteroidales bacterium]|nr:PstS family phosphate ABC transporter substrate-binding protein [Bacteroidales bacterium]
MKQRSVLLTLALLLALCGCRFSDRSSGGREGELSGNISLSGAFALYPITVKWAEEFQKIHPGVNIDISAGGAGKGMADALSKMVDLGMFSREVTPQEVEKGAWYIALTKDAVLPTINSANPFLKDLMMKGVTREKLEKLYVSGEITTWEELLDGKPSTKITLYTRSDACGAAAMWAAYLGVNQEDLLGLGVFGDPGVADAVKRDPLSIGYNNVGYVYDINSRRKYNKMEVLPLDLNSDGTISTDERFYETLDEVVMATMDGRYPSPPARDLYFVSRGKPEKEVVIRFIEWILTDGQQYLGDAGYVKLSDDRVAQELEKLHN